MKGASGVQVFRNSDANAATPLHDMRSSTPRTYSNIEAHEVDKSHSGPLHRIPSLDGLRAISIVLVLLYHTTGALPVGWHIPKWLVAILGNGETGVSIFFVISGFLITRLLVQEKRQRGQVSLRRFYLRRAFRIWPAFYVFIAFVALLWSAGVIRMSGYALLASAFYLLNYYIPAHPWVIGHTWSLALEEQFYMIWPAIFRYFKPRYAATAAFAIIIMSPFVRIFTYIYFPRLRDAIPIMLHTRMDTIMFGVTAALYYDDQRFESFSRFCFRWRLHIVAAIYLFILHPQFTRLLRGAYELSLGWTLEGTCIVIFVARLIICMDTPLFRLLNSPPMVGLGILSYSIYLWQQPFLTPAGYGATFRLRTLGGIPLAYVCIVLTALLSYFGIEKVFLNVRSKVVPSLPATLFARPKGEATRGMGSAN